jgi:tRNA(fMet)-specific endonuclease VapC
LSPFLLNTNAMSDLTKNPAGAVASAIRSQQDSEIVTSLIVAAELRYGAARKASPRLRAPVETLLRLVPVADLVPPFDAIYGDLRAKLESSGIVLSPHDLLIAAHAMMLHATLVTDDQVFSRVPGLPVENWIRA